MTSMLGKLAKTLRREKANADAKAEFVNWMEEPSLLAHARECLAMVKALDPSWFEVSVTFCLGKTASMSPKNLGQAKDIVTELAKFYITHQLPENMHGNHLEHGKIVNHESEAAQAVARINKVRAEAESMKGGEKGVGFGTALQNAADEAREPDVVIPKGGG